MNQIQIKKGLLGAWHNNIYFFTRDNKYICKVNMDIIKLKLNELMLRKLERIEQNRRETEELMIQIGFRQQKLRVKTTRLIPRDETDP